jgi:hypothetical protein
VLTAATITKGSVLRTWRLISNNYRPVNETSKAGCLAFAFDCFETLWLCLSVYLASFPVDVDTGGLLRYSGSIIPALVR